MQPDSTIPPSSNPPTEPDLLENMAALTGLFNPEIIWKEEAMLDTLDEQEAVRAAEPSAPTEPVTDEP